MPLRPPHQFRNLSIQPVKLGLVIPPGATISTDDDELAAQLDLEGGRQGLRSTTTAERAAADGGDATAAEVDQPTTKPKRASRSTS